jgi:hypothetical protein
LSREEELFAWLYGPSREGLETPVLYQAFERTLRSPQAWRETSDRLRTAARLVWKPWIDAQQELESQQGRRHVSRNVVEHFGVAPAALMLSAFAVENLLKAVIATTLPTSGSVEKIPALMRTHDLEALCASARIAINSDERTLLLRLQLASEWAGRYPTPTTPDKYRAMALRGDVGGTLTLDPRDPMAIECLLKRLDSEFTQRCSRTPESPASNST